MHDHRSQGMVLIAIVLAAFLFSCESNDAEKSALAIHGPVHVYSTPSPPAEYPGSNFIAVLGPKDHIGVRQVIHEKDYVAVRIRLSDGREGWVFSGENIELYKP